MITLPNISGKGYGVVGLGRSGRATVASLLASGATVRAWDDKESTRDAIAREFPSVTIAPVTEWDYTAMASLVMSPGILLSHPAVKAAEAAGIEVIGDIELLYRAQPAATYIGITGTNGKSTTTTLIAHILSSCGKRVEVGGNLGTPALALASLGAGGIYVLELSSYQLDLVRTTRFNTALLLNISPDHLDHHGSMENYIAAKLHIFDRQVQSDTAVIGIDDAQSTAISRMLLTEGSRYVIPISSVEKIEATRSGIAVLDGVLYDSVCVSPDDSVDTATVRGSLANVKSLQGAHNGQNAAAAYAACFAQGCMPDEIMAAMQTYPGLAHRMQWLGLIDGVQYVNDSKATNADAAEKALRTYDDIYWILGGVAKDGGIAPLVSYFPKVRHAYLIGEAAVDFAATLGDAVPYTHAATLENAVASATRDARAHKGNMPTVLLSPACASFDQFSNFEVRGEAFIALVAQLKAVGGEHGAPAA